MLNHHSELSLSLKSESPAAAAKWLTASRLLIRSICQTYCSGSLHATKSVILRRLIETALFGDINGAVASLEAAIRPEINQTIEKVLNIATNLSVLEVCRSTSSSRCVIFAPDLSKGLDPAEIHDIDQAPSNDGLIGNPGRVHWLAGLGIKKLDGCDSTSREKQREDILLKAPVIFDRSGPLL